MRTVRRSSPKRQTSKDKVLLALHWLSTDGGLTCENTDRQIAEASGRSISTVRECLRDLQDDKQIVAYHGRERMRFTIVVLGYPESAKTLRDVQKREIKMWRLMQQSTREYLERYKDA